MSFLSVLKAIGKGIIAADTMAAPFVTMLNPAAGAAMNAIAGLVVKAEQTYQGEKQGTPKKQMVMDEFMALLPMFQSVLKDQAGLILTINADSVSALVDATVAQFNAAAALHNTFKLEKVTLAPDPVQPGQTPKA